MSYRYDDFPSASYDAWKTRSDLDEYPEIFPEEPETPEEEEPEVNLHKCDRCSEKTDCVYPMARTYFGDWFEIKSNHSVRTPDGYFCYGCCDALAGGGE
jgi:hypothetical protein